MRFACANRLCFKNYFFIFTYLSGENKKCLMRHNIIIYCQILFNLVLLIFGVVQPHISNPILHACTDVSKANTDCNNSDHLCNRHLHNNLKIIGITNWHIVDIVVNGFEFIRDGMPPGTAARWLFLTFLIKLNINEWIGLL